MKDDHVLKKVSLHELYRGKSEMTDLFPVTYQTSSRNADNKILFLTSLLFLARSYRDIQHTDKFSNVIKNKNCMSMT